MIHLETDRLLIRSLRPSDEKAFIEMASDGSLTEIFGDCSECDKWMGNFIKEAMRLELENDPGAKLRGCGYAAEALRTFAGYILTNYPVNRLMATANAKNKASCKTLERAGFQLTGIRPYRDLYDEREELSHFYEIRQEPSRV